MSHPQRALVPRFQWLAARTLALHACVGLAACAAPPVEPSGYVVTIRPLALVLRSLVGDDVPVHQLLAAGTSPHTFEPRPSDLDRVAKAKALVWVGQGLDGWAAELPAPHRIEVLALVPTTLLHAFRASNSRGHEGAGHHAADHTGREAGGEDAHGHHGVDPHFWTDPATVARTVGPLVQALCERERIGERCEALRARGVALERELDELARELEARFAVHRGKRLLLGHPSVHYFLRRVGLEAPLVAEASPGKELSPRRVVELAQRARELEVRAVVVQPQQPERAARLVAEELRLPVVSFEVVGTTDSSAATLAHDLRRSSQLLEDALR